jgi:hypothetical protein
VRVEVVEVVEASSSEGIVRIHDRLLNRLQCRYPDIRADPKTHVVHTLVHPECQGKGRKINQSGSVSVKIMF